MPALRLRSGQAPAGIQGKRALACGYASWIPASAGMTFSLSIHANSNRQTPSSQPLGVIFLVLAPTQEPLQFFFQILAVRMTIAAIALGGSFHFQVCLALTFFKLADI